MQSVIISRGDFKDLFYKAMWFDLMDDAGIIPHDKLTPLLTPAKEEEYNKRMEEFRNGN